MKNLLDIQDLRIEFDTDDGIVHAVSGVSFSIKPGQTVGLVGESGCGKSVTAMSIARLVPQPPGRIVSGKIDFCGRDILGLGVEELRRLRGQEIGIIFQEPMTALSPLHRVRSQLFEAVRLHRNVPTAELEQFCRGWLSRAGIADPARCMDAYPFELSGGMRQRVMIAMVLMMEPRLVIADEPTTALDVTIQAQILQLMRDLKSRRPESGLLLITHDLGVVWELCDYVIVMYAGQIVEAAPVRDLFASPQHPYTRGLMKSIPGLSRASGPMYSIPGSVPSLLEPPKGCSFAPRCPHASADCLAAMPPSLLPDINHFNACCHAQNQP